MSKTKVRILACSIELFNTKGVNNVTLRDIAEKVEISIGNLAYHYKNKHFLIKDAFKNMEEERKEIFKVAEEIPSFEVINNQVIPLLHLAQKYKFLYLDTVHVVRNYPEIAALHRAFIRKNIEYTKAMIAYSVQSGNMKEEMVVGYYNKLAHTVWMVMTFWLAQAEILDNKNADFELARQEMWNLVLPHLTEKGRHNFKNIYEYAKNSTNVQL